MQEFPIIRDHLNDWFREGFDRMPAKQASIKKIDKITKITRSQPSADVKSIVYKYLTNTIRREWKQHTVCKLRTVVYEHLLLEPILQECTDFIKIIRCP